MGENEWLDTLGVEMPAAEAAAPELAPTEAQDATPAAETEASPQESLENATGSSQAAETPPPSQPEAVPAESSAAAEEPPVDWKAEHDRLLALMQAAEPPAQPAAPAAGPEIPAAPPAAPAVPTTPQDAVQYMTAEEFEEFLTSPDAANKVLGNLAQRMREAVLLETSQIVQVQARQEAVRYAQTQEFWTANAELLPYQKFVGQIANEIQAKNPAWTYKQILDQTAIDARQAFKVGSTASAQPSTAAPAKGRPAFAPTAGARPLGSAAPAKKNFFAELSED